MFGHFVRLRPFQSCHFSKETPRLNKGHELKTNPALRDVLPCPKTLNIYVV